MSVVSSLSGHVGAWLVASVAWLMSLVSSVSDAITQLDSVDQKSGVCSTQFDAVSGTTGVTLTNVIGMVETVVPGTYYFRVNLPGVSTVNCGVKYAFKYTTTVLSGMEAVGRGFTAAAVACQHTTTATDQAILYAQTAAVINTIIEGRMVVTTGGTVQLQAAQNASHTDTTSVFVGATMMFTKIG